MSTTLLEYVLPLTTVMCSNSVLSVVAVQCPVFSVPVVMRETGFKDGDTKQLLLKERYAQGALQNRDE